MPEHQNAQNGRVLAGAAVVDITPPAGLAMAGYAARHEPAIGTHDPLTARAVCVGDTAIVIADVIGLHEDSCQRIRRRARLDDENIVVAALHTHGGPVSMPDRVGTGLDAAYLEQLEEGCVTALDAAAVRRQPATIFFGHGADPDIARNRRAPNGPVDRAVPVIKLCGDDGRWIAVLTSYACHPVVLGADNRLWTADYPGVVRNRIEAAHEGAVGLFLTGCTGDANNGHSAQASFSLAANDTRTFAEAARIGDRVAEAAMAAEVKPATGQGACAISSLVDLPLERREKSPPDVLAAQWRAEQMGADPGRAALLDAWIAWAEAASLKKLTPWPAQMMVLDWAGVRLVAFPGEIFAETALDCRQQIADAPDRTGIVTFSYAHGCPGYVPPRRAYDSGGYEVDEAHRYYGMPAGFAPGGAELLLNQAVALNRVLTGNLP